MDNEIYKINDLNFLLSILSDNSYDNIFDNTEFEIEYVRELDFYQIEELKDMHGVNLFDREKYQSKVENQYIFDYIKNCDKLKSEPTKVFAKGNFFYIKWTVQSILKNGRLSFPIVIRELDNGGYDINPGHFATQCMIRCGITKVPCLIYKNKNTNLDFGGIKIKSKNDYINYVLKDISLLPYRISDNVVVKYNNYHKTVETYFYGEQVRKETIVKSWTQYYNYLCFIDDLPQSYGKIAKNTFPLKVFIGKYKNESDFEECKERILKSVKGFVPSSEYYQDLISDKINIVFYKWDGNINDISKRNKGFCIYTDSNVLWKESIFNLLFFTHSKKIIMKSDNDRVIIFNCQHSFWKSNGKVGNINQESIGNIPDYYTYI